MEASGLEPTRPKHRHGRGAYCARSHLADELLFRPGARQRREAAGAFRDHHASRLLFRVGKCLCGDRARKGRLRRARDPAGSGPGRLPTLLPLNEAAEADRAARVGAQFGSVAPGLVQYTADPLFRDLWLRPDLAPRDRSLVTVSALIASGQVAQIPYHLNRAMDNGLTQEQAAEVLTHLAFYVGWPNVFSALPVAKDVFEKRAK